MIVKVEVAGSKDASETPLIVSTDFINESISSVDE
jgi:hypothetical protein